MSEVKKADPTKTVDRVEFDSVYGAFAYTKDGKNWRLSGEEIARALNAQPIVAAQCAPQPSGVQVAWRSRNDLGEVVSEWIDGPPPEYVRDAVTQERIAVNTLKIDVAYAPPADDPHGDGHCGCTERCKDRDNCQYDTPQPSFGAVSCAAREALERAQEAIATLPMDALGYGEDDAGRWPLRDELLQQIHNALSIPAAGGEASKREAEIVERCAKIAEEDHRSVLARDNDYEPEFHRAGRHIAARIRASLRKDG